MAAIAKRDISGSTANVNNYTSNSFTPTAGDLLFVISHATGSVETAATCSASANSITFTSTPLRLEHTLSGNVSFIFVADQLVGASPSAMTVTVGHPNDPATGCYIAVGAATGMSKTGATAIKQSALAANLGAGAAYTATFGSAVTSTNPVVGFVGWAGTVTITAPPTSWTEIDQPAVQSTPTQAFEWAKRDSGETGTAMTWTASGSTTRANVAAVEFDSSSSGLTGTASVSESVSIGATGGTSGAAAVAAAVAITAAGVLGVSSGANVSETTSITAAGATSSSPTVASTATITATGVVGRSSGANVALTGTVSAAGGTSGTASVALTNTISADGATGSANTGSASLAETVAITATGVVGKNTTAAVTQTAAVTAAGQLGLSTTAARAVTVTITASGQVAVTGTAQVPIGVQITADGLFGPGAAAVDVTIVSVVEQQRTVAITEIQTPVSIVEQQRSVSIVEAQKPVVITEQPRAVTILEIT